MPLSGKFPVVGWSRGKSSFVLKVCVSWLLTGNNEVMAEGGKQDLVFVALRLAPHAGLHSPLKTRFLVEV